ncbi:MAG: aminoacyl-tRNA hydrolase [bacterium]
MCNTKEWLIAGLGNPGKKYELTRHNVGFWAIDALSERLNIPCDNIHSHVRWGRGTVKNQCIRLIKPYTYMNLSGEGIYSFISYFKIDPFHLIVFHDDMDLEIGSVKICEKRGSGGHRGVESIIACVGTFDFIRVRIGIGHPQKGNDPKEYVLSLFHDEEKQRVDSIIRKSYDMILTIIVDGIQSAMNQYNSLRFHESI